MPGTYRNQPVREGQGFLDWWNELNSRPVAVRDRLGRGNPYMQPAIASPLPASGQAAAAGVQDAAPSSPMPAAQQQAGQLPPPPGTPFRPISPMSVGAMVAGAGSSGMGPLAASSPLMALQGSQGGTYQQSYPSATVGGDAPRTPTPMAPVVPLPGSQMRPIGGTGSPQAQDVSMPSNMTPVDVDAIIASERQREGGGTLEQRLMAMMNNPNQLQFDPSTNSVVPYGPGVMRARLGTGLLAELTKGREQNAAELQRGAAANEAQIRAAQIQANAQGGIRPADIASLVVDLMPQVESQHPDWSQEAKIAEARRLAQSIVGNGTGGAVAGVNPMAVGQPRDYGAILREISGNPVEALAELRRRYSLSEEDAQPAIEALRGQFSREAMLPFEQGSGSETLPWASPFRPFFGEQTDEQAALEWIRRNAMGRGIRNLGRRIPE